MAPNPVQWNNYNFLIMSAPDDASMKRCIKVRPPTFFYLLFQDLDSYNVKLLVRSCEKLYDDDPLIKHGIEVHELSFDDGMLPEQELIDKWIKIIDEFFKEEASGNPVPESDGKKGKKAN